MLFIFFMEKKLFFATGNDDKFKEVKEILESHENNSNSENTKITIEQIKIDLPELQGKPEDVILEKAKIAYQKIKKPVFVDDTGLAFNSLNGMPGIYIKHFLHAIKQEGLFKLLNAFEDKSAKAFVSIGFCDGNTTKYFIGECSGKIVFPKSTGQGFGFGWDPIFSPDGYDEDTFATLMPEIKNKISHRRKAFDKFKKFLEEYYN